MTQPPDVHQELHGGTRAFILEAELEWTLARMVCHLIRELEDEIGFELPPRRVAEILCGHGPYALQPAIRSLDGFAILRYFSRAKVLELIEFLQEKDIFETRQGGELVLSERGDALLEGRYLGATGYLPVIFPMPEPMPAVEDTDCLDRLRDYRNDIAEQEGLWKSTVLPERTLRLLAIRKPRDPDDLVKIPGMGPQRIERYGDDLISILNE